jgi:shikimate dehydrogenase
LIGYPLGHSFSASYFEKKFMEEGINAVYRNFPLEQITGFRDLLKREPDLAGLNVTVPYKEAVIHYLDSLSAVAQKIQAVNTISFRRETGRTEIAGDNTDVIGFRRSLEEHLKPDHTSALVLGTGGSSRAVQYVLGKLGIDYTLVSRKAVNEEKGGPSGEQGSIRRLTYGDVDSGLIGNNLLIINTTPLGMFPDVGACPDIPYSALTPDHLLFDLIYNPARTQFLIRGGKRGAAVVNGYDMLVYQAEASWEIWNSRS